jgi:hypothetical protein
MLSTGTEGGSPEMAQNMLANRAGGIRIKGATMTLYDSER